MKRLLTAAIAALLVPTLVVGSMSAPEPKPVQAENEETDWPWWPERKEYWEDSEYWNPFYDQGIAVGFNNPWEERYPEYEEIGNERITTYDYLLKANIEFRGMYDGEARTDPYNNWWIGSNGEREWIFDYSESDDIYRYDNPGELKWIKGEQWRDHLVVTNSRKNRERRTRTLSWCIATEKTRDYIPNHPADEIEIGYRLPEGSLYLGCGKDSVYLWDLEYEEPRRFVRERTLVGEEE
ncbi:MAG: hypothetical protein JSW08_00505 [archaeon]|nr:MAG: hypothetical protein JSW08_00505 [archaeon]